MTTFFDGDLPRSWCHDCHCWHPSAADCPEMRRKSSTPYMDRLTETAREMERVRLTIDRKMAEAPIDPTPGSFTEVPNNFDFSKPLSGGSNDYYKVTVARPTSGAEPYTAECNDIIEALQMTYAEGNAFKAVWRHALARRGIGKQGNTQKYEAEKAEFFAKRLVEQAQ
jgi:hypothetical protein